MIGGQIVMTQHHCDQSAKPLSTLFAKALEVVTDKLRRGVLGFALSCFGSCLLLSAEGSFAAAKTNPLQASESKAILSSFSVKTIILQ